MSLMPGALAKWGELVTVSRTAPGIVLTPSAPFVAGNVISLAVNGTAIAPVDFTTDSPTTLSLLAQTIASVSGVDSAAVLGAAIVVQNPRSVAITQVAITGGASQPAITITGTRVDGRWVPATPTTFQVKALVTPKSLRQMEREMLILPEGVRTKATIVLATSVPLFQAGEGQGQVADIVTWRGVDYQVQATNVWDQGPLKHYESLAAKLEQES